MLGFSEVPQQLSSLFREPLTFQVNSSHVLKAWCSDWTVAADLHPAMGQECHGWRMMGQSTA